jgi:hypothetical protein
VAGESLGLERQNELCRFCREMILLKCPSLKIALIQDVDHLSDLPM